MPVSSISRLHGSRKNLHSAWNMLLQYHTALLDFGGRKKLHTVQNMLLQYYTSLFKFWGARLTAWNMLYIAMSHDTAVCSNFAVHGSRKEVAQTGIYTIAILCSFTRILMCMAVVTYWKWTRIYYCNILLLRSIFEMHGGGENLVTDRTILLQYMLLPLICDMHSSGKILDPSIAQHYYADLVNFWSGQWR